MNISSIINQVNNLISNTPNVSQSVEVTNIDSLKQGLDTLLSMGNNSVISGKIMELSGKDILLLLGDNEYIKANIEGNMNSKVGDIVTFEVKQNGSDKVSLSALFENKAQESMVSNAIKNAGMPDSPNNQYMVKAMMQEGLPIDKNSLYEMSRAININGSADVLNLAKMTRLDLPLTPEMVKQFEGYMNFENTIMNSMEDVFEAAIDDLIYMNSTENPQVAIEGFLKGLDILFDNNISALEGLSEEGMLSENGMPVADVAYGEGVNESVEDKITQNINMNDELMVSNSNNDAVADQTVIFRSDISGYESITDSKSNESDYNELVKILKDIQTLSDKNRLMGPDNAEEVEHAVDNNSTQAGRLSAGNIVELLKKIETSNLSEEDIDKLQESISKLGNNDSFKKILDKVFKEQFMLKPEDVSKEGSVSKLYENLAEKIKNISEILNKDDSGNTNLKSAVNDLNSNVNFINELNQTFNYVQIPLKMMNQEATGELYVYANKKKIVNEDGNISALLHLDMDNLGAVDIHVLLNNQNNVQTKFYLSDDRALDLIADNIEVLNTRLEKRGYNMSSEFISKNDSKKLLETVLEENKNVSIVSNVSFDARA